MEFGKNPKNTILDAWTNAKSYKKISSFLLDFRFSSIKMALVIFLDFALFLVLIRLIIFIYESIECIKMYQNAFDTFNSLKL